MTYDVHRGVDFSPGQEQVLVCIDLLYGYRLGQMARDSMSKSIISFNSPDKVNQLLDPEWKFILQSPISWPHPVVLINKLLAASRFKDDTQLNI